MFQIEEPRYPKNPLFQLGFRPFFIVAFLFAAIAITLWSLLYFTDYTLPSNGYYASSIWHAHEMIFGYGLAVVTGFLLTAEKNWTGIQTLYGKPLMGLLGLWLLARFLPFALDQHRLWIVAIIDNLFILSLTLASAYPIIKAKQWQHSVFPSKLLLLLIANILFYLGLLNIWAEALHYGLYAGFYLLLALIFTMGRRIIPFFIEKGVGLDFKPKNWRWLDRTSLWLFLAFSLSEIILPYHALGYLLAALLFVLHGIRLIGWYHPKIWEKSLLWSLYLGYLWIVFGFLLKLLSYFFAFSPFLSLHSFAYGGVGLITISMMARVSLGHTGRNVFQPPKILTLIFITLSVGALVRVILPLFFNSFYTVWIALSQGLWVMSFILLSIIYVPILFKPRVDGRSG